MNDNNASLLTKQFQYNLKYGNNQSLMFKSERKETFLVFSVVLIMRNEKTSVLYSLFKMKKGNGTSGIFHGQWNLTD